MKTKTRRLLQPIWNIFNKIPTQNGLLLCVSGGSDSRALLEITARWPDKLKNIHTVTIDHGVRISTFLESKLICGRAKILGFFPHLISLSSHKIIQNESNLRMYRYNLIWKLAKKLNINSIAVAHTMDDQAEGFIMDILGVGGGEEGAAMPYILKKNDGIIIRPLIYFSKKYLITVLTELKQKDYFIDPNDAQLKNRRAQTRALIKFCKLPKKRLMSLSVKTKLNLNAIKIWASYLITIKNAYKILVRTSPEMPETVLFQAYKKALNLLKVETNSRQARNMLIIMVKASKNLKITQKTFTLSKSTAKLNNSFTIFTRF